MKKVHTKGHRKLKLGVVLGAGLAKGFVHVGVLKVLHEQGIYPDYIAGTSVGAIIGAAYAAGRTPEDIEEILQNTDWRNIVDFTLPKQGFLKGVVIESKIRTLVRGKRFEELHIPLQVVAYDVTAKEKVQFSKGDVARAVRASLSVPGIFTPVEIGKHMYIDGGIVDPLPVEVVREMGADVVLVVDSFIDEKRGRAPVVHEQSLLSQWKEQFIVAELQELKLLLIPTNWPRVVKRFLRWVFDLLLYPARVVKMLAGVEMFPLPKLIYRAMAGMSDTLALEKMKNSKIDVIVKPHFKNLDGYDFEKIHLFVALGEKAMRQKLGLLRRKLRR